MIISRRCTAKRG